MNSRSRVRNARVPTLGVVAAFHPRGARPGGFRALQLGRDRRLLPLPLGEQRPDDDRLDQLQDLLAVRVVRPELRALAGVEAALEERPEDRRVDLRPVEVRRRQHRLDVGPLQRQRRAVVEQAAVEPGDRLEADPAARRHHLEELAGELGEPLRSRMRMPQHPREHVARQQADVSEPLLNEPSRWPIESERVLDRRPVPSRGRRGAHRRRTPRCPRRPKPRTGGQAKRVASRAATEAAAGGTAADIRRIVTPRKLVNATASLSQSLGGAPSWSYSVAKRNLCVHLDHTTRACTVHVVVGLYDVRYVALRAGSPDPERCAAVLAECEKVRALPVVCDSVATLFGDARSTCRWRREGALAGLENPGIGTRQVRANVADVLPERRFG